MRELYKSHLNDTCIVEKYAGVDKTNKKISSSYNLIGDKLRDLDFKDGYVYREFKLVEGVNYRATIEVMNIGNYPLDISFGYLGSYRLNPDEREILLFEGKGKGDTVRFLMDEKVDVIAYAPLDNPSARQVPCRIVEESETIKLRTEETVQSTHTIYLWEKVEHKDTVNGKDILELRERKSLLTSEVFGYRIKI